MFNIVKKLENNPSQTRLIMVFTYPILPLGLLATFMIGISWFEYLLNFKNRELKDFLEILPLSLWFLGGPAGVIACLLVLLKKHSKVIFWLFLYGALSYTVIAVMFIISGFTSLNNLAILHAVYLIVSLKVIIKQLYEEYLEAF